MAENISSFPRNLLEARKESDFNIRICGQPKTEVIEAAEQSRKLVLQEMNFDGLPPRMIIAEGYVYHARAARCAGAYDPTTKTVHIGQSELQGLLLPGSTSIPDEVLAALVAAEETAHYVQDKQGKLPSPDSDYFKEDAEAHYRNYDFEAEAARISLRIANRLFPRFRLSREHQGIDE